MIDNVDTYPTSLATQVEAIKIFKKYLHHSATFFDRNVGICPFFRPEMRRVKHSNEDRVQS